MLFNVIVVFLIMYLIWKFSNCDYFCRTTESENQRNDKIESLYKMNSELVKKVSELTSLLSIAKLDKSNESDIEPIEPEFIISNKPLLKRKPKGNRN